MNLGFSTLKLKVMTSSVSPTLIEKSLEVSSSCHDQGTLMSINARTMEVVPERARAETLMAPHPPSEHHPCRTSCRAMIKQSYLT